MPLKRIAPRVVARDPEKIDVQLAEVSLELDTEADNEWFRQRPGVNSRVREPTPLEKVALQLPLDARTEVIQVATGVHYRRFRYRRESN